MVDLCTRYPTVSSDLSVYLVCWPEIFFIFSSVRVLKQEGRKRESAIKRANRGGDMAPPVAAGNGEPRPLLDGVYRKSCDYCVR